MVEEAVIVSAARTPIGRFGGSYIDMSSADLGALAIKAALDRAGVSPESVEEVVFGCTLHVGEDTNIARRVAVKAGLPVEVPAYTVNRVCGSGLEAINTAARFIEAGEAQILIAGGTENMSQMPYIIRKARWGYRMGDGMIEDAMTSGPLRCPFNHYHMGVTAENVASRFEISRQAQDEFSLRSHQRALAAIQAGKFKDEIVPVPVPQPRGQLKMVDTDEHPRPDTSLEKLGLLSPAFKEGGSVTAGNSSGINDGAAAVVIMSQTRAIELRLKPLLAVKARAAVGVDPAIMGMGPLPATQKVLKRAGLGLSDIDLIELNEAFAAPSLAVGRELGLDWEKTNVNGGAIALGHPVGATGTILAVKLAYEMQRHEARYGLVTLCIGGGMGIATIFERPA